MPGLREADPRLIVGGIAVRFDAHCNGVRGTDQTKSYAIGTLEFVAQAFQSNGVLYQKFAAIRIRGAWAFGPFIS